MHQNKASDFPLGSLGSVGIPSLSSVAIECDAGLRSRIPFSFQKKKTVIFVFVLSKIL